MSEGVDTGEEAADPPSFDPDALLGYAGVMFALAAVTFVLPHLPLLNQRLTPYQLSGLSVGTWTFLYFGFSVTLVVYNKWLLSVWEGGFPFPMLMTLVHMSLKMVLSKVIVWALYSRTSPEAVPVVSWRTWFAAAAPVGVTTSLDVAASNASLFYVSVSVYTVVKSTTLVFVLIFSVLYRLQLCSLKLVGSVVVISVGVVLSSLGNRPEDLPVIGFFLVFLASAVGGYRWALTELLMLELGSKMSSLMTIYIISPAAVATLIPLMLWLEGGAIAQSKFYRDPGLFTLAIVNVIGSGLFAFAMIFVELGLLHRTSSLSLAVIGYLKQILQVTMSVIVFHEVLSAVNVVGMILTLAGMVAYLHAKAGARLPVTTPPKALQLRTLSSVIALATQKGSGGNADSDVGLGLLPLGQGTTANSNVSMTKEQGDSGSNEDHDDDDDFEAHFDNASPPPPPR